MATTKKGWRKIEVDDSSYRWRVQREGHHYQMGDEEGMTIGVIVEHVPSGNLLRVLSLPTTINKLFLTPDRVIAPGDVAKFIRQAKSQGWKSEPKQPLFSITETK